MSLLDLRIIVSPRLIRIWRLAGVSLFVLALLLPVCRDVLGQSYAGWRCAWNATGMGDTTVASLATEYLIVTYNLMVVIGFLISFSRRLRSLQILLAFLLLLSIPIGGVFLFLDRVQPLAGMGVWVAAGVFLLLPAPALVPARYASKTRAPASV